MARKNIRDLASLKGQGRQAWATAYDATMAAIVDEAVEVILIGDSLGNVIQGQGTTLPVTLEQMIYHTQMVARGSQQAFLVTDLPFMTYQASVEQALNSAGRLMKEAGCQAVKLEGGLHMVEAVQALVRVGIPVVGHLGMTPQSVHQFGGFQKQAKEDEEAKKLLEEAQAISEAGAFAIVLENIPHDLAKLVTSQVKALTIGIGAGGDTDGQVQVFHDLFGLTEFVPRHAVPYGKLGARMKELAQAYAADVKSKSFISK